MVVSETAPMCSPSLVRGIVVTLSTMMLPGRASPVLRSSPSGILNSGISVGSRVTGRMVTESVGSNRSSWITRTGRGLILGLVRARCGQRGLSMRLGCELRGAHVGNPDPNRP